MKFPRLERLPPYILAKVTQMMKDARKQGDDVINLGMGNPDLPTPPHIVEKLIEAAPKPVNHRYSLTRGIPGLRRAICQRYADRYGVQLDPEAEAIVTLGAKEGLSHLVLAMCGPGDTVLVPDPSYPIHAGAVLIAGAQTRAVPVGADDATLAQLAAAYEECHPKPKLLICSYPANPTTITAELPFFEKLVAFALERNLYVIHDLAYADLCFDAFRAPSILQVPEAKRCCVELYSMSKSYSMPGWRVAFCLGNRTLIAALGRIKSYLDYGMFQPIQIAAAYALQQSDSVVSEICEIYRERRDVLCDGLNRIGWHVEKPKATMFVWAKIPEKFAEAGSMAFAEHLLTHGKVAVSPGIGFGKLGEGYVRFALVENEERIRQAVRGIKAALER